MQSAGGPTVIVNTFSGRTKYKYAAFDTETHTYVNGELLPEEKIRQMCAQTEIKHGRRELVYPQSWWREHCEVKAWAYTVYTPDGFAIAETFDEFMQVIESAGIKHGWFYNAPFDFSILDYDLLSRGFAHVEKVASPMQYDEMCNDFGARYRMRIAYPCERLKSGKFTVSMYDLRNILPGGLKKNLESFKIKDAEGEDVRKLEMDYQSAVCTDDDIKYMRADVAGLWHLVDTAGEMFYKKYGIAIHHGKPEIYTASSLSKRYILTGMYPGNNWAYTQKKFRRDHPMTLERDKYYRAHGLLGGGRVLVNPHFQGQHLTGSRLNRFDANSHYPAYMAEMLSVYGFPDWFDTLEHAREWYPADACYILEFSELYMTLKQNAIPAWRDPISTKIVDTVCVTPNETSLLMFIEEFDELQNWYDLIGYKILGVHVYKTHKEPFIESAMRQAYDEKATAKAKKDKAGQIGPKLLMNGYGGKYSQNPWRSEITRVLDEYVRRVEVKRYAEESALMQVVQGARITANGRVRLLQAARRISGNDMVNKLYYGDTDSLHISADYTGADPYKLGEFKRENEKPIVRACFVAPKTYYEIEEDGTMELHAKGVHIEDVQNLIKRGVSIEKIFSPGYCVQSLTAINVKGGKALLPFYKRIVKGKHDRISIDIREEWD